MTIFRNIQQILHNIIPSFRKEIKITIPYFKLYGDITEQNGIIAIAIQQKQNSKVHAKNRALLVEKKIMTEYQIGLIDSDILTMCGYFINTPQENNLKKIFDVASDTTTRYETVKDGIAAINKIGAAKITDLVQDGIIKLKAT